MEDSVKQTNDMTQGKPIKVILLFAIPLFFGNIFQQLYNLADIAIVGHYVGDQALAAVGATGSLFGLYFGLVFGIPSGFSVVIARFFGAKQMDKLKKAVAMSILISVAMSFVLAVVGIVSVGPLLKLLNTPDSIFEAAKGYISILILGIFITMAYNVLNGILRAVGNTVMPLVFLIISSLLNVFLDIFFVSTLKMGVNGAAYATVIAQLFSVVLCIVYIVHKCGFLKLSKDDFMLDYLLLKELFSSGMSMGIMFAIVSIGSVALQSAINGFGEITIAAHISARKFVESMMMPLSTLSMSASTFASQNFGAMKFDRIKKGILTTLLLAAVWSGVVNVLGLLFSKQIVYLISGSTNEILVKTASLYIKTNVPFFFILIVLLILRMTLQGIGRKLVPIIASITEVTGKFLSVFFLVPILGYLGVCLTEPITWIVGAIIVGVEFQRFNKMLLEDSD